jgi:Xaa-Pro aminopeptidase
MSFVQRLTRFRQAVAGKADLVYFPISADLQYLAGVTRDLPSFGAIVYPGAWLEGLWLPVQAEPVLVLTRMTADFHAPLTQQLDVRMLADRADPAAMLRDLLKRISLPPSPRIAVGCQTTAETLLNLQAMYPGVQFSSSSDLLAPQRVIKSADEISSLQHAGQITESAFRDVLAVLRHGMTELELVIEVDYQLRAHGSLGSSFNTALYCVGPDHELVFGQHAGSWHRQLDPPVSILFDFGAIYQGYCYDFGRTVIFGEPDPRAVEVHALVMRSQTAGIAALQAGRMTAGEVDATARQVISEAGYGEAFRHRLGHGIGLDVHEAPFLTGQDRTVLQQGMCFTVEPSILIEDGLSARVEDIVVVGADGGVPLTSGFQDLIVVD